MNKPILSIMPDHGPYLWLLDKDSTLECKHLGDVVGACEFWDDEEKFLSLVSKELQEDFDDWIYQFEHYVEFERFNWNTFHKRGLLLARRLKKQLGDNAIVRYIKPFEDPNREKDEITIIE